MRTVEEVIEISEAVYAGPTPPAAELVKKYPIEDARWKQTENAIMFVYPEMIFCHDDPKNTELDPWYRPIRPWKCYEDDTPLVWQDRIQTHPSRSPNFPSSSPRSATYYAWTSVNGVYIPIYLVHPGTISPFTNQ